ncbi:MAG TPA: aminotransferase class I/II-fold pyridoxal phosphate-dependent enzyme, partial [Clostridia bacterium]|nr:aminotransferase class I/II-fold pyridoxal phosphate-dependent enzyme [Clostridia bacterium]
MAFINTNFLDLKQSYLFSEMGKRVAAFQAGNPGRKVISLGIGDVTRPLPEACLSAMHRAVDEMGDSSTFRGYSPDQGYAFLREAIVRGDFQQRGVDLSPDEIFVSDGAKSDTGNIGDIFNTINTVAITDPVYPVYADTNIMAGREIKIISCTEETGFAPLPPDFKADI